MDKFEKLVLQIMKEAEADGEPVTRKEAEEMAEMEVKASKQHRYEQAKQPKKRKPKVRKVDKEKKFLLENIGELLLALKADVKKVKTETEISFTYNGNDYTLKLTKHRPKK